MKQILPVYGFHKEAVIAIRMLYKNTQAMVHSPNRDTNFFDIVTGVLKGDTLAPYLSIFCLFKVLPTPIDLIKENGFALKRQEADDIPQKLCQMQTTQML